KRHREAAGMRRGNQLLRAGSGLSRLCPSPPRQRLLAECAARHTHRAAPAHEVALPGRVSLALNRHVAVLPKALPIRCGSPGYLGPPPPSRPAAPPASGVAGHPRPAARCAAPPRTQTAPHVSSGGRNRLEAAMVEGRP